MECFSSEIHINQNYNFSKDRIHYSNINLKKIISIISIILLVLITSPTLKAQEKGPLMMKQELGYTLGGGVFGAGLGIVVWFMDPLNPNVTLKSTVTNGFVAGTALGALFGFYMLQNAIVVPSDTTLPQNLDQLLGNNGLDSSVHRSIISQAQNQSSHSIKLTVFGFRF
tara:strand:+ start:148 stop:654 length:507 start_codon:yes stop_codon:yes gene_type:complete